MRGLKARESTEEEKEQYLAAALKFDEAAHEKLMKEAAQMQHILAGDHVSAPSLLSASSLFFIVYPPAVMRGMMRLSSNVGVFGMSSAGRNLVS